MFNNLLIVLTGDVLSEPETGEPEFCPRLARAFYGYNGGVNTQPDFSSRPADQQKPGSRFRVSHFNCVCLYPNNIYYLELDL